MIFDQMIFIIVSCSVLFGAATGNGSGLASGLMQGAADAASLCLSMAGPLCLWSGLLAAAENCGLAEGLRKLLGLPVRWLLPGSGKESSSFAAMNIAANLLGLGNAATPCGVKAAALITERADLGTFLLLNTCSVQLLPTTIAAVRSSLGAASPFDILVPVWLSSLCALAAALGLDRLFRGRKA